MNKFVFVGATICACANFFFVGVDFASGHFSGNLIIGLVVLAAAIFMALAFWEESR